MEAVAHGAGSQPLAGRVRALAATWPAAHLAGELIAMLGATVRSGGECIQANGLALEAVRANTAEDWASSGLAPLTGRPGGPDLAPVGMPATFARACGLGIEVLSGLAGPAVRVDWAGALSDRARILSLVRGGTVSAGGGTRLLRTRDGWCALSLPREEDLEIVPALTNAVSPADPWELARLWALTRTGAEVEARAELLGLAAGFVRPPANPGMPWHVQARGKGRSHHERRRLVVNLGSLWAAPLCARLLGEAGFRVVDVESPERPDGSRLGAAAFYEHLHAGHELAVFPLNTWAGRRELQDMLRSADVVITGSRLVSLKRLGATRDLVSAPLDQIWIYLTGHGARSNRIGFGDDAAAAAGLVALDEAGPVFAGDAIADPLTGLAAAMCAFACLVPGGSWDVHLALRDVAAAAAARRPA